MYKANIPNTEGGGDGGLEEEEEVRKDRNKMVFLMDGDEEGYAMVTTCSLGSAEIQGRFPVRKGGGEILVRIPEREECREFFYRAKWPKNEEEEAQARKEEKEEGGIIHGKLCEEPKMGTRERSRSKTPTTRVVWGGKRGKRGTPSSSSQGTGTETGTETGRDGDATGTVTDITETETETETVTATATDITETETATATDATEVETKDERTGTENDAKYGTRTDEQTMTDQDTRDEMRVDVTIGKDRDKEDAGIIQGTEVQDGPEKIIMVATETVIMPESVVQVIMGEEEEDMPLACRKGVGSKKRAVIMDEEEEGGNLLIKMELCSTTDMDTDCTEYKRRLRKRGMAGEDENAERKDEERRKKKIKRKSKSRSPEDASEIPSDDDSTEGKKLKGKTKTTKEKERMKKQEEEENRKEEVDTGVDVAIAGEEIGSMPTFSLGAAAMEWVDEIEECRRKSGRIQGVVSGTMKRNLAQTRDAIMVLMARAQATGDQWFLQAQNKEQQTQIAAMRKEIEELRKEVGNLRIQIRTKEKREEKERKEKEREREEKDLADLDFPPLPQRPPLRGRTGRIISGREISQEQREEEVSRQAEALETMGKEIGKRSMAKEMDTREGETQEVEEGEERGRGKPRVISDVQLMPPLPLPRSKQRRMQGKDEEWVVVKRKKENARKDIEVEAEKGKVATGRDKEWERPRPQQRSAPPPPPPRIRMAKPPKHAAVTITGRREGFSYAEAMREARAKISLADLGITSTKVRRAINGGLLIEIEGEEGQTKADNLVAKLKEVLQETATVVSPRKFTEIRVSGLDDSVTAEELSHVLAIEGECEEAEIRIGPIRMAWNGLGSAWARIPTGAAAKTCARGRIRIGWTMARIEVLEMRPLQCHRCLHYGHVKYVCRSKVDREGACYNCGEKGHQARSCKEQSTCVVCKDEGRPHGHRLGGPTCRARTELGKGKERREAHGGNQAPVPVGNEEGMRE